MARTPCYIRSSENHLVESGCVVRHGGLKERGHMMASSLSMLLLPASPKRKGTCFVLRFVGFQVSPLAPEPLVASIAIGGSIWCGDIVGLTILQPSIQAPREIHIGSQGYSPDNPEIKWEVVLSAEQDCFDSSLQLLGMTVSRGKIQQQGTLTKCDRNPGAISCRKFLSL